MTSLTDTPANRSPRHLGTLAVSAIGLGAMPLSLRREPAVPREQAMATVHAALDAGVTLIDTADIYAPSWDTMGHNEEIVAEALRTYAGDSEGSVDASGVVVATKGGITRADGEAWGRDGSATYLRAALERSLERLGTSSIDLYYWHRPDRTLRYADGVEALASFQQEGLIREIGISNANVEEIDVALDVLGEGGLAAVQNQFSPTFFHTSLRELRHCGDRGVGFVPWSPLGGIGGGSAGVGDRFPAIRRVAEAHGVSPQRVTLAWQLALGEHVVPIPGAGRPASIEDSAAAMDLVLTPAEREELDAILG